MAKRSSVLHREDAACRKACRWGGVSPAAVARFFDRPPSDPLTFSMLRESHDFPRSPLVIGADLGPPYGLLHKLESTDLWVDWTRSIAEHDLGKRHEVIARGLTWDFVVVSRYSSAGLDTSIPHVILGRGREQLKLCLFEDWLATISWSIDRSSDTYED